MSIVDKHLGQRLVEYPFSPKPPEPEVVVQEVVREPDMQRVLEEKVTRQEVELARLSSEIALLTNLLARQTEEAKVAALYLGRKDPEGT